MYHDNAASVQDASISLAQCSLRAQRNTLCLLRNFKLKQIWKFLLALRHCIFVWAAACSTNL